MIPERYRPYSSPEEIADHTGYRERVSREIGQLRERLAECQTRILAMEEALSRIIYESGLERADLTDIARAALASPQEEKG